MIKYADCTLVFKILNRLATAPLQMFIQKNESRSTRATSRGDCIVPFRKSAYGQAVFSYRATHTWNTLPAALRELPTLGSFKKRLKVWLLESQNCSHYLS